MIDGEIRIINWSWRNYARKPWPVVKYTRHMKWLRGCSSLLVGPYEFLWATRDRKASGD